MDRISVFQSEFYMVHFNIILQGTPLAFQSVFIFLRFPTKTLFPFVLLIHGIFRANTFLYYMITRITFVED